MGGGENNGDPKGVPDEPRENDTMLDIEDEKRRPGKCQWAADTLGLSVRWLLILAALALLALILLIVVIVLGSLWPPPPPVDTSVRCETADCLRAAAQLRAGLAEDESSACDSFWDYTCSEWIQNNPIPSIQNQWGVIEQLKYEEEERLQRLLSTLPQVASPRSYIWKLDAFYQGCMDRAGQPDRSELAISVVKNINELGGFDAIGSFQKELWNPAQVIRDLQAKHNIDVFFRVEVVPRPGATAANIIQISPGGVGLPERSYYFRDHDDEVVVAYQRYIQDVLLLLGAPTNEAGRFSQNMYNYEKRLVEASLDPLVLRDPTRSPDKVTVDWLRKESPQVDWLHTLQSIYPGSSIEMDTEVLLPDKQYIIELSKIISSTATSSMNAYLMWRLIAGYHPYLPDKDRAVLDVLHTELTGVGDKPPVWLTCARLTREFFPLACGALLARDRSASERQQRHTAAESLFTGLTQTLGGLLTYSRFISDTNRAHVLQKISAIDLHTGYPPLLLDEKLLDSMYAGMNVMRYSFAESVQAARQHQRTVQQKALLAPGQDWELEPLLNADDVTYDQSRNAVVVPDLLMTPPIFDPTYPPAFQYGGLGTRMAGAILASVDPASLTLTADELANVTASGQRDTMSHNHEAFRSCVAAALTSSGVSDLVVQRVGHSAPRQVLAIRLTLEALSNRLQEVGEQQLPGMEQAAPQKIFYLVYGQSLCKVKTEEKQHWDEHTKFSLDGKLRLHLTIEQTAQFRDVFGCNATQTHHVDGLCGGYV